MKTKTFDCVEMKRRASEQLYEILKDMSFKEQAAFWQEKKERLKEMQKDLQERQRDTVSSP